jgi:cellobiose transport system permease protein
MQTKRSRISFPDSKACPIIHSIRPEFAESAAPGPLTQSAEVLLMKLTNNRKNMISAYLYISPFYLMFAVFGIFPIYYTFFLAFYKWDGLGVKQWVGLRNFDLLFSDPVFWQSVYNTFVIGIIGTVPQIFFGLILAFTLNQSFLKFRSFFQTLFFMPNVTSIVAVAIVFAGLFTPSEHGIANFIISLFGMQPVVWDVNSWGIKIAISTMVLWRWTGYVTVIFLAGLQSIPNDLYEAATIDGASSYRQFLDISVPLLRPFIIFVTLIATIGSLQLFAEPNVFLGRGMRPEGMTVVVYLYQYAFEKFNLGYASAASVALFIMIMIFSALNTWLAKRGDR